MAICFRATPERLMMPPFYSGQTPQNETLASNVFEREGSAPAEELRRRERELHEAEFMARIGFWRLERSSGLVKLSPGAWGLLGEKPTSEAVSVETLAEFLHPDDREEAFRILNLGMAGKRRVENTCRIRRPDGTEVHLRSSARPVFDEGRRVVELYGVCQDVTEQVRSTAALRESEDHYRHAVELSAQIPWTADAEGNILEAGPRWSQVTGLTVDTALGTGWSLALHPDDVEPTMATWGASLRTGARVDVEYRVSQPDGGFRWMRATAGARRGPAGEIVRWYGALEDINDRRLAEEALRESEAFSRSILENTSECIEVLDPDGRIRFMNGSGARLLECEPETFVGRDWVTLWPPEHQAAAAAALDAARAGNAGRFTARYPTRTGLERWWEIIVDAISDARGGIGRLLVTSRDVTEARRARAEIDAAHSRLAAVLESTNDYVIVVDRQWRVTYMNRHTIELLAGRLTIGSDLWKSYPEYVGSELHRLYQTAMDGASSEVVFEIYVEAHCMWAELRAYPSSDGISIFFRDVTQDRKNREEIAHLAHHDPLTGLANRASFQKHLAALPRDPRGGAAIFLLDLDDFKEVNDGLGHPVGDALLVQIAQRFAETARDAEIVARVGGDEFAIIQSSPPDRTGEALARRLIACLDLPFEVDGNQLRVGVSIGISIAGPGQAPGEELFKQADIALYEAKANGGRDCRVYEPGMHEAIQARQALKQELADVIDNGELEIFYQPLICLMSGCVTAYEALLRWHHPTRGTVSPAEFIPLAEETGLIVRIGEWVLREACREAMLWPSDVSLSVNLSPVQFRSGALPLRIAEILGRLGFPPQRLELEITESVLLHDSRSNIEQLHAIKNLGARIALDDFGTGFASLNYLRTFPFDKIKIDRAFVGDLGRANHSEAIVGAVVAMGAALNMTVTAEGVETGAQLEWLKDAGCGEGQGYLIGRPAPAAAIRGCAVS